MSDFKASSDTIGCVYLIALVILAIGYIYIGKVLWEIYGAVTGHMYYATTLIMLGSFLIWSLSRYEKKSSRKNGTKEGKGK